MMELLLQPPLCSRLLFFETIETSTSHLKSIELAVPGKHRDMYASVPLHIFPLFEESFSVCPWCYPSFESEPSLLVFRYSCSALPHLI